MGVVQSHKTISILGSTGSIGEQTLAVIDQTENYSVGYLTVQSNIQKLEQQIQKYNPIGVVIASEQHYKEFKATTSFTGKILFGVDGLCEAACSDETDILMSSLVGFSGVKPTLAAIERGKTIALANKETLISAGEIIMNAVKEFSANLIAVDSEHNALLQCIVGEDTSSIESIILTASGGPFFSLPLEDFPSITLEKALKHPKWKMGSKITIDSSTLMNKGFEVIEAKWLFDLQPKQIKVLVHPQSIVHSLVEFTDGSMKAQLGMPDMRIPISYALSYPKRNSYNFPRLALEEIQTLQFYPPDFQKFPCLQLAFDCLEKGGNATAILNAANEIAVSLFLDRKITYSDIVRYIDFALNKMPFVSHPSLADIIETDTSTRSLLLTTSINDITTNHYV
jgi:1-deoxy-D-xylulose-5-phosphate reductoisomerase